MFETIGYGVAVLLLVGLTLRMAYVRKPARPSLNATESSDNEVMAQRMTVVSSSGQEIGAITVLEDCQHVTAALDRGSGFQTVPLGALSRRLGNLIQPLCQVAPTAVVAGHANSRQLMEVVIDGQLLAASDGEGLRAIAKASRGFEHARLYEPSKLQNAANAAALWQIASVVVAQKHMADISAALKRIDARLEGIQAHLETARRAIVSSAMDYLEQAQHAFGNGEFSERTRAKLEDLDVELNRVSVELSSQIRRECGKELTRDVMGCKGEYVDALRKHEALGNLVNQLLLCNDVRVANWYMCSLHPDNSQMLQPRMDQMRRQMREAEGLGVFVEDAVSKDISSITAVSTPDKKIVVRRREVRDISDSTALSLKAAQLQQERVLDRLKDLANDALRPQRLLVEVKNGNPVRVVVQLDVD